MPDKSCYIVSGSGEHIPIFVADVKPFKGMIPVLIKAVLDSCKDTPFYLMVL